MPKRMVLLLGAAGCDALFGLQTVTTMPDAAPDAFVPRCDPAKPFATPQPIADLNSSEASGRGDLWPKLTSDELVLMFGSTRDGDFSYYTAQRPALDAPFAVPPRREVVLKESMALDVDPWLSSDGRTVVFASKRSNGAGELDVWLSTRQSRLAELGIPTLVTGAGVNTPDNEYHPAISEHDGALWFTSARNDNNANIWRAAASSGSGIGGPFEPPVLVTELSTPDAEGHATVRADGLVIYFSSTRPGGAGEGDIWRASRATPDDAFGDLENVSAANGPTTEEPGWVSADDCHLYLHSNRGASQQHLYVAKRPL